MRDFTQIRDYKPNSIHYYILLLAHFIKVFSNFCPRANVRLLKNQKSFLTTQNISMLIQPTDTSYKVRIRVEKKKIYNYRFHYNFNRNILLLIFFTFLLVKQLFVTT